MTQPQIITLGAVAAAVVVIGGGTAIAARNAQPGDMLYNVRASLYGDSSMDAGVDADMEGVRDAYEEAERMQAAGTLTADEKARLTADYSAHVNAVASRIAALEAQGDLDAAARIRTDLRAALREYRDVFPTINVDIDGDAGASMGSDGSSDSSGMMNGSSASSDMDDDGSSASGGMMDHSSSSIYGASSSIFVQPSSSVTSA
jgi:hypothetical protein